MKIIHLLIVVILGGLLIFAEKDFPAWGSADTPANHARLSEYYIQHVYDDTYVPNMVTAVLADYRSYDTMFETTVVFIAGLAIFTILNVGTLKEQKEGIPIPARLSSVAPPDLIVKTSCRVLVPIIQMFALYVLAHGHHSPGGGFQGGVILAASFIMLELSTDLREEGEKFTNKIAIILGAVGVIIYAGWGILALFFGGPMLDYSVLSPIIPDIPGMARSHSMLIVEVGVAFTVTSIMVLIFRQLVSGGYTPSESN